MRYHFEDCALDVDKRELRRGGDLVSIAPQVFDLLEYLILNRERVVSKNDLINAIWKGRIVSDAAVTTRLNAARSTIGDSGEEQRLIKTLPRKGFRFIGAVREEQEGPTTAAAAEASPKPATAALTLPDKASIAVLPFANLNADAEQEYFAEGVVGDIITELSRFSELFVIARNSSFQYKGKAVDVRQIGRELGVRYVLEGSVRRSGGRLRISAQLIDAVTGALRWAEHYDRNLEEVFAIQDEVVRAIVALLAAHVRKAETERMRTKPPESWQAYDYYLKGAEANDSFATSLRVEDLYETQRLLKQSLAIDPNYARAYAILANTQNAIWSMRLDSDFLNPAALDLAHRYARKAVELDPNLRDGHAILGFVLALMRQHDASLVECERAITLNPNYVDWPVGYALITAGEAQRAIDVLEACMRLDPFHPPWASLMLGAACFMVEQYPRALRVLQDYVSRVPQAGPGHLWLALTYTQLGRLDEARSEVAEVLRLRPGFQIRIVRQQLSFKHAKDEKHYFDALRKAGLPE